MSGSARRSGGAVSTLWIMIFTVASSLATLALACATPFTALAAIAATQMRLRDGVGLMLATWVVSQAIGFCMLDYPRDAETIAWAAALGVGAIAALLSAWAATRLARGEIAVLALAFLAASIGFKLVILLCSLGLGGIETALSPEINARQLIRNGAILAGLAGLHAGLVALGVPAPARRRAAAA